MARYSLDSNIVSAILKKRDEAVLSRYRTKLTSNDEIIICPFVYYEVYRGLLDKGAPKQLDALGSYVATSTWLEFNREIWNAAADGWAKAKKAGFHREDPDLLIAYHAKHFSAVMVTANTRHFEKFGIPTENWHQD